MRVQRVPIHYHGITEETVYTLPYTNQTTLAAKLMKQIATVDEVKFLSGGLNSSSKYWIGEAFNTVSVRVFNSLVNFVNDRTIRSDLVMFDYTHTKNQNNSYGSKYNQFETGWLIQMKKEEIYVELSTRFERTWIQQTISDRVKHWWTKKGSTAKDIPGIVYVFTLKVFDTPKSFYYIDLYKSSRQLPCGSSEPINMTNVDFLIQEVHDSTTNKLLQLKKERINERAVYFRNKG